MTNYFVKEKSPSETIFLKWDKIKYFYVQFSLLCAILKFKFKIKHSTTFIILTL